MRRTRGAIGNALTRGGNGLFSPTGQNRVEQGANLLPRRRYGHGEISKSGKSRKSIIVGRRDRVREKSPVRRNPARNEIRFSWRAFGQQRLHVTLVVGVQGLRRLRMTIQSIGARPRFWRWMRCSQSISA